MSTRIALLSLALSCLVAHPSLAEDPYIVTQTRPIVAVNPGAGDHPGGRGADELVVYTPAMGKRTGTNPWGIEATVAGGFVTFVGGNDSAIPPDGLVISGHGTAATWIATTLTPGMKVQLDAAAPQLILITDTRSRLESARHGLAAAKRRFDAHQERLTEHERTHLRGMLAQADQTAALVKDHLQFERFEQAQEPLTELEALAESVQLMATTSPAVETRGFWDRLSARSPQEIADLMDELARTGANCYLPEVLYGGATIVPSEIIPQHRSFEGWDPLAVVVEEGHRRGIEVHAWVENMFVGRAGSPLVERHPDWLMKTRDGRRVATLEPGYHYFSWCIPEARTMLLEHYKEIVRRYPGLAGLHLDYIRFPVTSAGVDDFDYCDPCRGAFKTETGLDPMDITPEEHESWQRWNDYREWLVDTFVEQTARELRAINPKIQISAAVFMPLEEARATKFQNWRLWVEKGWLDFICPMIYTHDQQAVATQTAEMVEQLGGRARVYPGLGAYLGIGPMRLVEQVSLGRDSGGDGVVMFSWRSTSPEQRRVLREGPFRNQATPTPVSGQ